MSRTDSLDAQDWDDMYRHRRGPTDEGANPFLAEAAAHLAPGHALDVACGQGSDALWLSARGWKVSAVDFSKVALDHARAADVAGRVNWIHADLRQWEPPARAFDLVGIHYLHLEPNARPVVFARLAGAVAPGGVLLVVAHHASHPPGGHQPDGGHSHSADLFFSPAELQTFLPQEDWEVLHSGTAPRSVKTHDGRALRIHDTVLKAQRRGARNPGEGQLP